MIDHIGSLCSGYGGLDRALSALLRLPFGWHAEIEKVPDGRTGRLRDNPVIEVLNARYPGVPNLGDITTMDWHWAPVGRPIALAAGFPCQAVSSAGAQLGEDDPRWLWPAVRGAIDALRPEWLAIENVANLVSIQAGALWRGILADLAELGYSVAWGIFGACLAEVGGCHHRHRVFALARQRTVHSGLSGAGGPAETRWAGKACGVPPKRATLLATPVVRDADGRGEGDSTYWEGRRRGPGIPLGAQVGILFPTPVVGDGRRGIAHEGRVYGSHSRTTDLGAAVAYTPASQLLPTPATRDALGGDHPSELGGYRPSGSKRQISLSAAVLLPSPRATGGVNGGPGQRGSSGDLAMSSAVQPEHFGAYTWAVERWSTVHGSPPAPTAAGPRGGVQLRAQFSEWMMGLAPGFVTDVLGRKDALHAIGNGVFPRQAYHALRTLADLLTA